jgi:hypothetical protein
VPRRPTIISVCSLIQKETQPLPLHTSMQCSSHHAPGSTPVVSAGSYPLLLLRLQQQQPQQQQHPQPPAAGPLPWVTE